VTEEILPGGDVNLVVRIGDTVRRPTGPWSPAVHALLRHFETSGFDGAPRFLGIDEHGREILTYVGGDAALPPVPAHDSVVEGLAQLVRQMHDAQEGFHHTGPWFEDTDGPVICFHDFFPPNVVFREGLPVALIDWDLASPGAREDDVAALASWWAPLRPDGEAEHYGLPTDRRGPRLRSICDSYGLESRADLVKRALERRKHGYELHRRLGGEERRPGWREMWDAGSGEKILEGVRWLEANQSDLERWLS
jgi:Phosphotransferase enzyme family